MGCDGGGTYVADRGAGTDVPGGVTNMSVNNTVGMIVIVFG